MSLLIARCVLAAALAAAGAAPAADVRVAARETLPPAIAADAGAPALRLTLVNVAADLWSPAEIRAVVAQAMALLAPCGVAYAGAELLTLEAAPRYRDFHTPASRALAHALALPRPAVYFVADTRQRPAFDAEAVGRGNSRTRPELADTVWITRAARDPGIALAHELVHVLSDSGEHSTEPGNLMREQTGPGNTRLTEAQCRRLRDAAAANGLWAHR
jgi:hypothetical protein